MEREDNKTKHSERDKKRSNERMITVYIKTLWLS